MASHQFLKVVLSANSLSPSPILALCLDQRVQGFFDLLGSAPLLSNFGFILNNLQRDFGLLLFGDLIMFTLVLRASN